MKTLALIALAASALTAAACAAPLPTVTSTSAAPTNRRATRLFFSDSYADLEPHPELFWKDDGTSDSCFAIFLMAVHSTHLATNS